MTNDEQQILDFILQQLAWAAEQDLILEKMEGKLLEMRELAVYRLAEHLPTNEVIRLQGEMERLQYEVQQLEGQLYKGEFTNSF